MHTGKAPAPGAAFAFRPANDFGRQPVICMEIRIAPDGFIHVILCRVIQVCVRIEMPAASMSMDLPFWTKPGN